MNYIIFKLIFVLDLCNMKNVPSKEMEKEWKAVECNKFNGVCGRYPIRWIEIIERAEYRFELKISTYSTLLYERRLVTPKKCLKVLIVYLRYMKNILVALQYKMDYMEILMSCYEIYYI